ncbi:hypothetical protein FWG95_04010 [Candidatus Saccharibacteria bacterium]|nr:hypothetical protein [Candidatus Saccharibacteria bacterium]
MKRSEIFTRIILVCIAFLALVAIGLQIYNEKTGAIETSYEIITFGVSLIAVTLAVLQGLDNAKTSRELHKIAREIKLTLNDDEEVLRLLKEKEKK